MIEYYTIATIAILGAISPGPDFVVVTKNCLMYQRRSGICSSLGVGAGILIHSTYCVLGLALVISQSILLFSIIKYLGAAYLIYLGVKSLLSKNSHLPTVARESMASRSSWLAFRDGLLTNVLNPKCTLFMLSIFTLVVNPHTPMLMQASYGVEIALITAIWFVFLSYGLTAQIIQTKIEKLQYLVTKLIGGVLITLGIAVIFESK